jgi:hypothetical protein
MPTIPVLKTVGEAYAVTFGDLKGVALLAWQPALITLGFGFIVGFAGPSVRAGSSLIELIAMLVVSAFCNSFYALAMHRRRLFGQTPATSKVRWHVGSAEGLFLAFSLPFILFWGALMPILFLSETSSVVTTLLFAAAIGITLALTGGVLILPAAAQGQPEPVRLGWHLGKGIRLRLLAVILATSIPLSIVSQATSAIPVAGEVFPWVFQYLHSATVIAAVCIVYKTCNFDLEQSDTTAP